MRSLEPRTRSPQAARGNALVEFVLVLPLFLTIVLGAIDWGWYFAVREIAINATRQGARVGAAAPSGDAAADAATAASSYLAGALGGMFESVTPTVRLTTPGGVPSVQVSLNEVPVVPTRPDSSLTGLIAWTRVPARVTAQSEMRIEQP